MPVGYRERIAPSYLAQVYRGGTTAVEYARRWLRDRSLMKCSPAQEMLSIMEAVDDAVLGQEADVINTISFEKLGRRAYGLERAFEGSTRRAIGVGRRAPRVGHQGSRGVCASGTMSGAAALWDFGSQRRTRRFDRRWRRMHCS